MTTKSLGILFFFSLVITTGTLAQQVEVVYREPGAILKDEYGIDTANTALLVSLVDTAEVSISEKAAAFLAEKGISSIASKVKDRFNKTWQETTSIPEYYVLALYLLKDPQASTYAGALIDSLMVRRNNGDGLFSDYYFFFCVDILVNLGDYSRFALVNSLFDDDAHPFGPEGIPTLAAFATKEGLRDSVYRRLQHFLSRQDDDFRWQATYYLSQFTDMPGQQSLLQTIALNDSSWFVRGVAMDALKKLYYDPLVLEAAKRIAVTTQDTVAFSNMIVTIELFDSPQALVTLKTIANELPPGYFKDFAAHFVEFYAPSRPHAESSVLAMIDSLRAHVPQVATLGWLSDENFVNELDNGLENARKHLAKGDSVNAYKEVQKFQEKIQKEYDKTQENQKNQKNQKKNKPRDKRFVTTEGYKFLYYNAQYILDRLPKKK